MKIIPAIDIIDGKAVRLTGGDYSQMKIYDNDPLRLAQFFESSGFEYLHLVDLDGAKSGSVVNLEVLEKISNHTQLKIDFGGGVKSTQDLQKVLAAGAKKVTVGTLAVKEPTLVKNWLQKYGGEIILLGADVQQEQIAINGWQEKSNINLFDFIASYRQEGITEIICTDISKDGFLQGTALELYQKIREAFPSLKVIASGGVSSIAEIEQLHLMGCSGAIIGKAIYEEKLSVEELLNWSAKNLKQS